jgi:hypothetical protein
LEAGIFFFHPHVLKRYLYCASVKGIRLAYKIDAAVEDYALCYVAMFSRHYLNDIRELSGIEKRLKDWFQQGPFLVEFVGGATLGILLSRQMLHDVV